MWWFRPSFRKKFERIKGGSSSSEVQQLLGAPREAEDRAVPLGSTWGTQPELTYKIRADEPVRQWMFVAGGQYYYIWFAKASHDEVDPWRVTLKKVVPHRL